MIRRIIPIIATLLLTNVVYAADVYEISVNQKSHKFAIDAATFIGIDFSVDKFSPLYGSGEITFKFNGEDSVLKFNLSKKNIFQVWHNKEELRLIFHDESSFMYDKVHGDDITLTIIAKSKDGRSYEGEYTLVLKQYGLKTNFTHKGKIKFSRNFRYHP